MIGQSVFKTGRKHVDSLSESKMSIVFRINIEYRKSICPVSCPNVRLLRLADFYLIMPRTISCCVCLVLYKIPGNRECFAYVIYFLLHSLYFY